MRTRLRTGRQRSGEAEGTATVEFAIILTVLLMVLLGIIEFGYDWYLKSSLANASRDAARFGTRYTGATTIPSNSDISAVVNAYLTPILPSGTTWTTTPTWTGPVSPPDHSGGTMLTVQVSTVKTWSALGNLLPSLHLNNMTISASTTMVME